MTETDNQIMNELENTVHQNWKEYSDGCQKRKDNLIKLIINILF